MAAITWSGKAEEDLERSLHYWSAFSENSARLQLKRIFEKIHVIETFPRSGRVVPEFGHPEIRELTVGTFRIVYYIVNDTRIDILTVHHAFHPLDVNDFSLQECTRSKNNGNASSGRVLNPAFPNRNAGFKYLPLEAYHYFLPPTEKTKPPPLHAGTVA